MSYDSKYKIACHCGLASQIVSRPNPATSASGRSSPPLSLNLCHCRPCRKNTGLLCVSYMPIKAPEHTIGLVAYRPTQSFERFFCGTCGCHVFSRMEGPEREAAWAVATGVIEERISGSGDNEGLLRGVASDSSEPQYTRHINVMSTRDGGLSTYLPEIRGIKMNDMSRWGEPGDDAADRIETGEKAVLLASCHCGNVSFHISRPDESSNIPERFFSDLIHPNCSTPPDVMANPKGEKWWLRPPRSGISPKHSQAQDPVPPTRYLAGTCACRSCRLTSGFEIQTWAFVPRSNIFFHIPRANVETTGAFIPVDFRTLPSGILKSYNSSLGIVHDFCAICGATVIWREEEGAEVIDISAGLFDAAEGARGEDWLEWWTERVSFSEEVTTGRSGEVAARAQSLIESLERGMREVDVRSV